MCCRIFVEEPQQSDGCQNIICEFDSGVPPCCLGCAMVTVVIGGQELMNTSRIGQMFGKSQFSENACSVFEKRFSIVAINYAILWNPVPLKEKSYKGRRLRNKRPRFGLWFAHINASGHGYFPDFAELTKFELLTVPSGGAFAICSEQLVIGIQNRRCSIHPITPKASYTAICGARDA